MSSLSAGSFQVSGNKMISLNPNNKPGDKDSTIPFEWKCVELCKALENIADSGLQLCAPKG